MKHFGKFSFLLLCITLILGGSSCKKERPVPVNYLPQAVVHYAYYKTGTWWVYQEKNNLNLDSITVYSSERYVIDIEEKGKIIERPEVFEWYGSHQLDPSKTFKCGSQAGSGGQRCDASEFDCALVNWKSYVNNTATHTGLRYYLLYPFLKNDLTYFSDGKTEVVGVLDSLSVGGNTFHQVGQIRLVHDLWGDPDTLDLYWKKHIGIIRKTFRKSNEDWELIKYNVIQ